MRGDPVAYPRRREADRRQLAREGEEEMTPTSKSQFKFSGLVLFVIGFLETIAIVACLIRYGPKPVPNEVFWLPAITLIGGAAFYAIGASRKSKRHP
jgi:hypothetical protein